jgi:hypothetical protein
LDINLKFCDFFRTVGCWNDGLGATATDEEGRHKYQNERNKRAKTKHRTVRIIQFD